MAKNTYGKTNKVFNQLGKVDLNQDPNANKI